MNKRTIAFQGEPGAYSELAAYEYFHDPITTLPCQTFEDVFAAVEGGQATHGLLPIENSLAGSIHHNYDLLLKANLQIVGEYHLRVSHCLMAIPGVRLEELRQVYSHPQALAQCQHRLREMGLEPIAAADTAGSARLISQRKEHHIAALASKRAAAVYSLDILQEDMEDNPENYTRFLVLTLPGEDTPPEQARDFKTSIVFSLHNEPGALFKALSVFALRDIDLTKIESRPIQGRPWEYMFYIDFSGQARTTTGQRALDHLAELAPFLRVLGSYPRHKL